jgi:hypothetical protein
MRVFETLHPANGRVILGDGKTELSIKGVGTIKCNFRLSESIYGLFFHIQCPQSGLHSSFEDGLYIMFPDFKTKAFLGHDDIYLDAVPVMFNDTCPDSVVPLTSASNSHCILSTVTFCCNVKQFHDEVTQQSKNLDNLLKSLRHYYKEVK